MTTKPNDGGPVVAPVVAVSPPAATGAPDRKPLRDKGPYRIMPTRDEFYIMTDDVQLADRIKGAMLPRNQLKLRRVVPGDIVTDLPAVSVPHMLRDGDIVAANGPADPYAKPVKGGEGGEA